MSEDNTDVWRELIRLEDAVEPLTNRSVHPKLRVSHFEAALTVNTIRSIVAAVFQTRTMRRML